MRINVLFPFNSEITTYIVNAEAKYIFECDLCTVYGPDGSCLGTLRAYCRVKN